METSFCSCTRVVLSAVSDVRPVWRQCTSLLLISQILSVQPIKQIYEKG
jgi:hypothetical protein